MIDDDYNIYDDEEQEEYYQPAMNESRDRENSGKDSDGDMYYSLDDDIDNEEDAAAAVSRSRKPEKGKKDEPEPEQEPDSTPSPIWLTLKLIARPVQGWKDLKHAGFTPSEYAWQCFYPLAGLAAAGKFANLIYSADGTIGNTITEAIVIFMSLLIGNFGAYCITDIVLAANMRRYLRHDFGRVFIMAIVTTLSLALFVWELIPMLSPLLAFLPLYSIYLIVKGVRFLRVPEAHHTRVAATLAVLSIGMPMLLYFLFNELLPTQ